MSSDQKASGTPPPPEPGAAKKPEGTPSNLQSSLGDALGLTVTRKPAEAKSPALPKPKISTAAPAEPAAPGLFVKDAAPATLAPNAAVRGSEPNLPKTGPRTQVIEGLSLWAKQGIDTPKMPVSFRPRDGWSDMAGRNIGKESGFRNTRMAQADMEANNLRAWAEYNKKQLDEQRRGSGNGPDEGS